MELHIEAQHTEVDSTLRDWIGARCEALNTPHADIVQARVALVKHPRHLRGSDEAHVVCTLSGKMITVTRAGETLEDALYKVFDVLERELHDFRSVRRGVSKDPGPRVRGRIVRLFADRGYGFRPTRTARSISTPMRCMGHPLQSSRSTRWWIWTSKLGTRAPRPPGSHRTGRSNPYGHVRVLQHACDAVTGDHLCAHLYEDMGNPLCDFPS